MKPGYNMGEKVSSLEGFSHSFQKMGFIFKYFLKHLYYKAPKGNKLEENDN